MKKELETMLISKFPLLYGRMQEPNTARIFCGDGWFETLWDMSEDLELLIQKHIDKIKEGEDGDNEVSRDTLKFCFGNIWWPSISCILKEDGILQVYMIEEDAIDADKHIEFAVRRSRRICEQCGKLGTLHAVLKEILCKKCLGTNNKKTNGGAENDRV